VKNLLKMLSLATLTRLHFIPQLQGKGMGREGEDRRQGEGREEMGFASVKINPWVRHCSFIYFPTCHCESVLSSLTNYKQN